MISDVRRAELTAMAINHIITCGVLSMRSGVKVSLDGVIGAISEDEYIQKLSLEEQLTIAAAAGVTSMALSRHNSPDEVNNVLDMTAKMILIAVKYVEGKGIGKESTAEE